MFVRPLLTFHVTVDPLSVVKSSFLGFLLSFVEITLRIGEEKSNLTAVEDMSLLTGSDVMGYLIFPPLIRNWKIELFRVLIDPLIWEYFSEVFYTLVNLQGLMMDHVEISQPVNITLLSPNISNLERHKN